MKKSVSIAIAVAALFATSAAPPPNAYSVLIHGGTIYDGSGGTPYIGDVAIKGDKIVYVGPHAPGRAARTVNATGKAISPGFINMLSWANESLIADGRGLSDTMQGVTLEVMGEGDSMGPWNPEMKRLELKRQADIKYPIRWTTLGQNISNICSARALRRTSLRSSERRRCASTSLARRMCSPRRRNCSGCARWSGRR
jgi:N-acyl-D-amino-acid deacylase